MDYRKIISRVWGWFLVSVCVVGVPHTAKYAYIGIKSSVLEAKCLALEECEGKEGNVYNMKEIEPKNGKQRDALQLLYDSNPGYLIVLVPEG